jgi:phosphoribosylamine--glycine ligase
MNVLLLGSGGREFTFAWKLSQSPLLTSLYIAPGNAGTTAFGQNVSIDINDFESVGSFVQAKNIEIVIVGPEEPLVRGIVDYFQAMPALSAVKVFGPAKKGARLEGSKEFAKIFMTNNNIPTAAFASFTREQSEYAHAFIDQIKNRIVLKADGLAAGKGVIIPKTKEEAHEAIDEILVNNKFGESGKVLVIEDFMEGIELSVFVLTDGVHYKILPAAKDYKRIGENDTGPNTGGMGAVSPIPHADPEFMKKVEERIIIPTIKGLRDDNISYKGFIFFGLMRVGEDPYVIEYNVRMGDPETQVVFARLQSDLLALTCATMDNELGKAEIHVNDNTAVTVVLVSGGYPGNYEKGKPISGLSNETDGIYIHAGTAFDQEKIVTSGGRVLACTAWDKNLEAATQKAYSMADKVEFDNAYYRRDIGFDLR